jgi:iron(III) transport system permease protein
VPGTVLAVGLLTPLAAFDNMIASLVQFLSGHASGLLLSGSGIGTRHRLCHTLPCHPHWRLGSRLCKRSATRSTWRRAASARAPAGGAAHPLCRFCARRIGGAALLVFVDCMKELPATLLLRPLNFDTLATWLYAEAARGTYEEGAIAALAIVLAGLLPVILLARNRLGAAAEGPYA